MKILAFNSSPRKNNGATDMVLDEFICFEQNARAHAAKIVGKIYCPSSEALKAGAPIFKNYLRNCYLAGKEVVEQGKISDKMQESLYKDFVMPKFLFRFLANRFWKKQMT